MSKLVFADYFLGFSTREVSGDARPWRLYYPSEADAGLKPPPACDAAFSGDLYLSGNIKDIACTYYPAIGPYDTADPGVAEYHVLLAKAAGIDGFMAEFTLGQEEKLLTLVEAARRHDFRIGVNWINQSHLGENAWTSRQAAIEKAHELVRWMVANVYRHCGVRVDDRYLLMIFLAHPREPAGEFDPFFSPREVRDLKQTAAEAGADMNVLVLPWEPLPPATADQRSESQRVWDGYFPWIWFSTPASGAQRDAGWTHVTTRQQHVEKLREYYASAELLHRQGRIGRSIGAVCPGFDDHKGQAWGQGHRRLLPRDGGSTLADTWDQLRRSGLETALIITWNDWVESSQIEPSLELGDSELVQCAREIARWKQSPIDERLLRLPLRLLEARRRARFLRRAGSAADRLEALDRLLDETAGAIAAGDYDATQLLSARVIAELAVLDASISATPVHLLWEHGVDPLGLDRIGEAAPAPVEVHGQIGIGFDGRGSIGFRVSDSARQILSRGHFVGRFCVDYLDAGTDFLQIHLDAVPERWPGAAAAPLTIASFRKADTGTWQTASLEIPPARWSAGLDGADLRIVQRPGGTGGVRRVRMDGTSYRAGPAPP